METFGSSLLEEVQFNSDGSLKASGKQQAKFYSKRILDFRAKPLLDENGEKRFDDKGKPLFEMDPKTGMPKKEAFEKVVDMIRVETKGDTNIKDDIVDEVAKRQFYRQYKFYKDGKVPDGKALEDFDFLQPSTIMELHLLGVHVIEQLAVMGDLECSQVTSQPGFEVRDIAQQWLKINSPAGQTARLSKAEIELKKAQDKIRELESKAGGKVNPYMVIDEPPVEPEPEVATMEIPVEGMKKSRGRPRIV